jgi:hypothetical protein
MAGMAEAAQHVTLMIAWGGLLIASIAAFVAFTKRSWIPVVISAVAVAGVTILFMPWNAFAAVSAEDLEDPDVVHWVSAWRVMASAWILVVLLALAAAVVVKVRRSRRAA